VANDPSGGAQGLRLGVPLRLPGERLVHATLLPARLLSRPAPLPQELTLLGLAQQLDVPQPTTALLDDLLQNPQEVNCHPLDLGFFEQVPAEFEHSPQAARRLVEQQHQIEVELTDPAAVSPN